MRRTGRRATLIWLIMIGILLSIVLVSEVATPALQLALATLYILIATAALIQPRLMLSRLGAMIATWSPPQRTARPTKAAQVAEARAERLPNYRDLVRLIDVGLIISEVRRDGMWLQRARTVSLDDQAIQPYTVVHAYSEQAGRTAILRFEVIDQIGEIRFVCEDEVYLHEGENAILSSHRLPLRENEKLSGAGQWELRASLDGWPIGLHSFGVGPSLAERRRLFTDEGEVRRADRLRDEVHDPDDEMPMSLEELLRGHSQGEELGE